MNHGEWIGSNIHESNRMLILGESHYGDENGTNESMGKPVPYTTEGVVRAYKEHKIPGNSKARWDKFFDQMAACFGYPKGKGGDFYNEVFFGNYVPVLCGIAKVLGSGKKGRSYVGKKGPQTVGKKRPRMVGSKRPLSFLFTAPI